ncbi:MAG TPA: DUF1553 domain-containing protein, partial [Planctomycetia bacterium]|nr:DUF1553 domain-containing protein [Planctomycetia bacterium]
HSASALRRSPSPRNPLTRRVLVNRLWRHHFGVGIVETPSDFGKGGERPSHPELLDWLAEEFAARGWSQKALHRSIVTSAAYRQRSAAAEAVKAKSIDVENRLFWRMNPRRLEAESVRDGALAASGTLDRSLGGPGYRDFDYVEAYAPIYKYVAADRPEFHRRSLYRFIVRTTPHPLMTTLDGANPACVVPVRNVTTTPLQALALLNHGLMRSQAERFAKRVKEEVGEDPGKSADRAFALALSRPPTREEADAAAELVKSAGLPALCLMLFNLNEFVYVD